MPAADDASTSAVAAVSPGACCCCFFSRQNSADPAAAVAAVAEAATVTAEAPLCGDHSEASVEALPPVVEPLPLDDEAVTGGTCGKSRGVTYIRHGEIWLVRYVHNVLSKGYILIKKAYSADLLLLLQGHFSDVSEDEVEAVVVLEDANGLVVGEAVEAATVHLADLVTGLRVGEHQSSKG